MLASSLVSRGVAALLDLRSGRTSYVTRENVRWRHVDSESVRLGTVSDEDAEFGTGTLNDVSVLNEAFGGAGKQAQRYHVRNQLVTLRVLQAAGMPVGLYAQTDGPSPPLLRLTSNAEALSLSADGRTLFFTRDRCLWRLDLRKPLPELLAEAQPPPLPDPSER